MNEKASTHTNEQEKRRIPRVISFVTAAVIGSILLVGVATNNESLGVASVIGLGVYAIADVVVDYLPSGEG